jgi:hypothetical protein
MSKATPPKAWGSGRIAVLARLDTIRSELAQGLPLTVIYDRHKAALGIGYPAFCKHVETYAGDAKLITRRRSARDRAPNQTPVPSPKPAPPVTTAAQSSPAAEEPTHARHEPRPRTFVYDGNPRHDDKARLIGTGYRSPTD